MGPLKTGTNCPQKRWGLSVLNLRYLEIEIGKQL
jgi:hypothetical protein